MALRLLARGMVVVLVITLGLSSCPAPRTGPDGRVRTLCLGDVIAQWGANSFTVIEYDPAIRTTLVPSRADYLGGYDIALRNMRIYMPRTYEKLNENFDLILTSDADPQVFKPEWIDWLSSSIVEGDLGLLWLGSIVHYGSLDIGWEGTTIAEVLPTRQASGHYMLTEPFRVEIIDGEEELMQALPWESSPPLANLNTQVIREGSSQWAKAVGSRGEYPLMTHWEIGGGAVLCFSSKFPAGVLPWAREWKLFPQAMIYMVYRVAEKPLPSDPLLFEDLLNGFIEFSEMSSMLESMLDWVEKFGGNPGKLRENQEFIAGIRAMAEEAYLAGEFDAAMSHLRDSREEQALMREAVMAAKDEALFWVYVTEWCALLGTLMISSYALWILMVRRSLYREIGISRLRQIE